MRVGGRVSTLRWSWYSSDIAHMIRKGYLLHWCLVQWKYSCLWWGAVLPKLDVKTWLMFLRKCQEYDKNHRYIYYSSQSFFNYTGEIMLFNTEWPVKMTTFMNSIILKKIQFKGQYMAITSTEYGDFHNSGFIFSPGHPVVYFTTSEQRKLIYTSLKILYQLKWNS